MALIDHPTTYHDQHPVIRAAMPAWATTAKVTAYMTGDVEVLYLRRYAYGAIGTAGVVRGGAVCDLGTTEVSIDLEGTVDDLDEITKMIDDMRRRLAIAPQGAVARAQRAWSPPAWAEAFDRDREALAALAAELRARNYSPATLRNYDSILRTAAQFMGKALLDATTPDLRGFIGREGQKPATRATNRAVLRAFYRFAVDEGYLDKDPVRRIQPVKVPRGVPRPFTREQITKMLTTGAYKRTRAMILLGYHQGFRVSMIAAVHGHDIDLEAGRIRTVGKGSKERMLPLHPVIAELAEAMPKDDYWFPARGGRTGHITGHAVSELISDAIRRAGITDPTLTAHSLRHSYGSELVEAEVDIRVIQELMMHDELTSTQIYTQVSERRMRQGNTALPALKIPAQSGRRVSTVAHQPIEGTT